MVPKIPPSVECVVKCEFGKKQTGYIARGRLLAFLQETFGNTKEFGIEVKHLRTVSSVDGLQIWVAL